MIAALFSGAIGKIAPFRWYAIAALALGLVGAFGWQAWKIRGLQLQLALAQQAQLQVAAEVRATAAAQAQAQRRMDDIKLHNDWLLQQMGEDLPGNDEEAKAFFWRHAKEIGR